MVSVWFPVAAQAVQQALLAMFSVDDDAQFHISDDWNVWLLVPRLLPLTSTVRSSDLDLIFSQLKHKSGQLLATATTPTVCCAW